MKRTFTIFGHTGFIGTHLKKKLQNHNLILPNKKEIFINKNLGNIIYCIGSDHWKTDVYNSFEANLGYIPKILKCNKFSTFNFLSSIKVYGNVNETNESSKLKVSLNNPNAYYMIKKICAESIILSQKKKFKIIRLSNIYGDNFDAPLLLPTFIRDSVKFKKIFIKINQNSLKNYLNVNDAVNLISLIINKGKENIYNIASERRISLKMIAEKIKKKTNCKIFLSNQKLIMSEPKISILKIKKEFNFKETSSLLRDLDNLILEFKKKNNYE